MVFYTKYFLVNFQGITEIDLQIIFMLKIWKTINLEI